jgi:hypothetical protein
MSAHQWLNPIRLYIFECEMVSNLCLNHRYIVGAQSDKIAITTYWSGHPSLGV